jgi:hypothetical protein
MGLFMLVGTLVAGVLTRHLGVVTVLNIQGTSYVAAGLFLIWGLPKGSAATRTVSADPADPVAAMIAPESDTVRL